MTLVHLKSNAVLIEFDIGMKEKLMGMAEKKFGGGGGGNQGGSNY